MYGYGYGNDPWMHGPGMFGGRSMSILCIVLIAIAAVFLFNLFRASAATRCSKTSLDILKKRYALGEIEKDEFDRKKHNLRARVSSMEI